MSRYQEIKSKILKAIRHLVYRVQEAPLPPSDRSKVVRAFELLTDEVLKSYSVSQAVWIRFSVLYPTIDQYSVQVRLLRDFIEEKRALTPGMVDPTRHLNTTLDAFLINKDRHYVNPQRSFKTLRFEVLKLCHAMLPAEIEEVGLFEHNQRLLTPLYHDLLHLVHVIESVCEI